MSDYDRIKAMQEEREKFLNNLSVGTTTSGKSSNSCRICNSKFGWLDNKIKVGDGNICQKCFYDRVISKLGDRTEVYETAKNMTTPELLKYVDMRTKEIDYIKAFKATDRPTNQALFDDNSQIMLLSSNKKDAYKPEDYSIFSYDQIVDFELLEDGDSIASGGVGRAVVGGALFGITGAVVGASTRKEKQICHQLTIKITMKNYPSSAFYMDILEMDITKGTIFYKERMKNAHDILSKLSLISKSLEEKQSTTLKTTDAADEIRKYKALMDEGIITADDFEKKKKQLLGI